ncbi:DUF1361 domain-containing protein [Miltoncostaea marina]|uniref:DUF1361 domain-containing protein n=1 Tax=Miltoncostaea marina TaxID=2843215 RepID=UPI001C3DA696|nr:DUF1361 domain-containing protein [Miltoncostaea marina]
MAIAREDGLLWLAWNLLLAWIPLALALAAARAPGGRAGRLARAPLLAGWLLFLPNAPYLVTDLIHLDGRTAAALRMDVPLFCAFAATGLLIFLVALHVVHRLVAAAAGARVAWATVVASVWLSAAGIYLGRVLRWNSWDLVDDPLGRLAELAGHLGDGARLAAAAAFVAAFGAGLSLAYSAFGRAARSRGARPG